MTTRAARLIDTLRARAPGKALRARIASRRVPAPVIVERADESLPGPARRAMGHVGQRLLRTLPVVLLIALAIAATAHVKGEVWSPRLVQVVAIFSLPVWPAALAIDAILRRHGPRHGLVIRALFALVFLGVAALALPAVTFALVQRGAEGGLEWPGLSREAMHGFVWPIASAIYLFVVSAPRYALPLLPAAVLAGALWLARRPSGR